VTRVSSFRSRQWAVLTILGALFVTTLLSSWLSASQSTSAHRLEPATATQAKVSAGGPRQVVLVLGDSLVYQSAAALRAQSSDAVDVRVASMLGTAPCDWAGTIFDNLLKQDRPDLVVLAFSGNAGASKEACVSTKQAYPLAELLSNYREYVTKLANQANAAGATVVISTPPARNPAAPPPPVVPTIGEMAKPDEFYGFQGTPEVRDLYTDIATMSGGQWRLSEAAALAISPHFTYSVTLPCVPSDGACPSGRVAVRRGHDDAIHLDSGGHGAERFAAAMIASALSLSGSPSGA